MKPISYYQNITGEKGEDPLRKDSAFWNEGKWRNFVEPLLPKDLIVKDATFIDIGASNGLFCKLAEEKGFKNVYGIESDIGAWERGLDYKLKNGGKYTLLHQTVGEDFNIDDMPVADIYLLSNVHYYFKLSEWLKFLDRLIWKTEYCLIITRPFKERKDERPLTDIDSIKHYFKDWELVRARYRVRQKHMEFKGDPKPRVLHAFLFRSKLRRKRFDELIPGAKADAIKIDREELVEQVLRSVPILETSYYKAWKDRMYPKKWDEKTLKAFVFSKIFLIQDIIGYGVREPILITADYKTIDGKHRIAILKALGYESIICRMI